MKKLDTSKFDPLQKRLLFLIAHEAKSIASVVAAGADSFGELYEGMIFLIYFLRGSYQHEQLSARLRDHTPVESITDSIKRIAPEFHKQSMESMAAFLEGADSCSKYHEAFNEVFGMLNAWRIPAKAHQ